jgi:hypothetical protein
MNDMTKTIFHGRNGAGEEEKLSKGRAAEIV